MIANEFLEAMGFDNQLQLTHAKCNKVVASWPADQSNFQKVIDTIMESHVKRCKCGDGGEQT